MEKQRVHLATESQKNFSSQQSIVAEVFMHAFHFITQIIKKKKSIQRSRPNLYCFKAILK